LCSRWESKPGCHFFLSQPPCCFPPCARDLWSIFRNPPQRAFARLLWVFTERPAEYYLPPIASKVRYFPLHSFVSSPLPPLRATCASWTGTGSLMVEPGPPRFSRRRSRSRLFLLMVCRIVFPSPPDARRFGAVRETIFKSLLKADCKVPLIPGINVLVCVKISVPHLGFFTFFLSALCGHFACRSKQRLSSLYSVPP